MLVCRDPIEPGSSCETLTVFVAALLESHRHGTLVATPTISQASLSGEEILAVQRIVAEKLGARIAGWKIAKRSESEIAFAPIYGIRTKHSPTRYDCTFPGPIQIEIEIALILVKEGQNGAITISEMKFGIEFVRSRLAAPNSVPYWAFHCDNLGNDGYVLLKLPFREAGLQAPLEVQFDGRTVWTGSLRHPLGDPRTALPLLTPILKDHLGGLQAGHFVTTGNLCSVPFTIDSSTEVTVSIGGLSDSVHIIMREDDVAC